MKCDIEITQYDNGTVKCKKKNKGTTKYKKQTVKCDVQTTQCENETVKYEEKKKKNKGTIKCDKRIDM